MFKYSVWVKPSDNPSQCSFHRLRSTVARMVRSHSVVLKYTINMQPISTIIHVILWNQELSCYHQHLCHLGHRAKPSDCVGLKVGEMYNRQCSWLFWQKDAQIWSNYFLQYVMYELWYKLKCTVAQFFIILK